MEENKRFRNHISVVAEQIGAGTFAVFAVAFGALFREVDEVLESGAALLESGKSMYVMLGITAAFGVILARNLRVWAKTWISVQDKAIVVEKNTVNRKVYTIGIRHISNMNLEQNLFEMLMGTAKVKLDTSSMSTADQTDVKIVLKKADAERFRRTVMELIKEEYTPGEDEFLVEDYDVRADTSDIIRHGLCSISIFSVVIALGGIAGMAAAVAEMVREPDFASSLLRALTSLLAAGIIVLSSVWDIVKDFVRYFDFRVKRRNDKLYIKYGILKKVEYTVPVSQIQALRIRQTPVARAARRYMAELINVGMGDEKGEQKSFFILYTTEEDLQRKLGLLLPEFRQIAGEKVQRQPASAFAAWLLPLALYEGILALAAVSGALLLERYRPVITVAAAIAAALSPCGMLLNYFASGMAADGAFVKTVNGYFGRTAVIVRYGRIQYLTLKQNAIARACGIQKGNMMLLASSANRSHHIPYFRAGEEQKLKACLLKASSQPSGFASPSEACSS